MCIDPDKKILYIYDEIYMNRVADDAFANQPEMKALREKIDGLNKQGLQ
jgi:hypothetical protein